jgi:uncharacterized Zn finger protein (UPF0148 family)
MKEIKDSKELEEGRFYWVFDKFDEEFSISQFLLFDSVTSRNYFTDEDGDAIANFFIYGPICEPASEFVENCNLYVEEKIKKTIEEKRQRLEKENKNREKEIERLKNIILKLEEELELIQGRLNSSAPSTLFRQYEIGVESLSKRKQELDLLCESHNE